MLSIRDFSCRIIKICHKFRKRGRPGDKILFEFAGVIAEADEFILSMGVVSVDLSNFYSSGDFFVTFCLVDKKLRLTTR